MASNISLNQFAPNSKIAGMYAYMANQPQLHNVIISASQTTVLEAGAFVAIDSSSTNTNAPVVKQAAGTDNVFGVISFNPLKNQWNAGDRIAIARNNDIVFLPAAGAIAAGAELTFNSSNQVTSTVPDGNTVIGIALTPASAEGDLIQVELHIAKAGTFLTQAAADTRYQAKLTAGDFIDITNNTITTTYTAGTGIAISAAGAISTSA